jgi:hypothetical protein
LEREDSISDLRESDIASDVASEDSWKISDDPALPTVPEQSGPPVDVPSEDEADSIELGGLETVCADSAAGASSETDKVNTRSGNVTNQVDSHSSNATNQVDSHSSSTTNQIDSNSSNAPNQIDSHSGNTTNQVV